MKRFMVFVLLSMALSMPVWAAGDQETGTASIEKDEPMTVTFGYWKEEIWGGEINREKDLLIQKFESELNLRIEPVWVTWADFQEKYKLWAAAGQLPDFFAGDLDQRTYLSWVEQGLLKPLPEDMSAYPELEKNLKAHSHLAVDGRFYSIPRLVSAYPNVAESIYVRKDWMKKLGIAEPRTWEEFKDMLKRFVTEDPDGNGIDDTIGLLPRRANQWKYLMTAFSPSYEEMNWIEENGRWIPSFYSKQTARGVSEIGKLFSENLLYSDFLLLKNTVAGIEKFAYGNVGALLIQGDPPRAQQLKDIWTKYNPDQPLLDHAKILLTFPFESEDGIRYNRNRMGFGGHDYFRGDISDEKMAKILELLNFLNTEEGTNLWYMGIEGTDYTKEGDGYNYTRPVDEDGKQIAVSDIYPSSLFFGGISYWGNDKQYFNLDEINYARHDEDLVRATLEYAEMLTEETVAYPTDQNITAFGNDYLASKGFDIRHQETIEAAIISDDPEATWKRTLEQLRREGIEEHIEYINKEMAAKKSR